MKSDQRTGVVVKGVPGRKAAVAPTVRFRVFLAEPRGASAPGGTVADVC